MILEVVVLGRLIPKDNASGDRLGRRMRLWVIGALGLALLVIVRLSAQAERPAVNWAVVGGSIGRHAAAGPTGSAGFLLLLDFANQGVGGQQECGD